METAPTNVTILRARQEPDRSPGTIKQIGAIVDKITTAKNEAVQRKQYIEERWLEDLRNYHGRYADIIEAELKAAQMSRLFANLTRPKTNAWAARLGDMLFPSDENNWGIGPTPVPTLARAAKQAAAAAKAAAASANQALAQNDPQGVATAEAAGQAAAERHRQIQAEMDIARERAAEMEKVIADQLIECDYNIRNRLILLDGCKLGTGVLKGPLARHRVRRGWEQAGQAQQGPRGWTLKTMENPRPEMLRTDPWLWYPDPDAVVVEEMEYSLELHMPNEREVRRWAEIPGFDKAQLGLALSGGAKEAPPSNLVTMRGIADSTALQIIRGRYMAWEYHGSLSPDEAGYLAAFTADQQEMQHLEEADLIRYPAIIWLLSGNIVKWAPHPLDSGDPLYSAWNFEKDEGSIFGFGVPYLMRNSQAACNGAWRLTMNNGGVASGPQVLIDRSRAEPADGNYEAIYGFKVWFTKAATMPNQEPPISFVQTDVRQVELQNIITMAMKFIDEETNMPVIAMGDAATHITKTAQGMAMLMNSVNVIFRRGVKNFDDMVTTPTIRRMYDWNMAFNDDEDIKGDFDVQAKGSSVLLVRELEAQNLMTIAERLTVHPKIGPLLKDAPLTRRLFRAHMLPVDELVKDDDTIDQEAAAAARNPPVDPEIQKLQTQQQIAQLDSQTKVKLAEIQRDVAMLELSAKTNVDLAKIKATLQDKTQERELKDRHLAVESAMAEETGRSAGGAV